MLIPRFVQCVTGLLLARSWLVPLVTGLLLACSWLVPLVTDLFLACSACYWLVPLVPCFSNVVSSPATMTSASVNIDLSSWEDGIAQNKFFIIKGGETFHHPKRIACTRACTFHYFNLEILGKFARDVKTFSKDVYRDFLRNSLVPQNE